MALDLPRGGLYAVADGMGGHAAGELAANLALDTLTHTYLEGRGSPPERLAEAVQAANLAVIRHAVGESVGMGTTLLAILIDQGAALVAHVGDSRAYLLRDNELLRLTEDHSWVAEQVRLGFLSEEEAREHQWKSVVNNALGGEERVRLELFGLPVKAGDRLLICSDGLSGVVPEVELLRFLSRRDTPETVARLLVNAANDAGGPDNITAVLIDITQTLPQPRYALPPRTADGPEYVDILLSARRGNGLVTYLILTVVYFTLLGMILLPERRTVIGVLGTLLLLGSLYLQKQVRQRQLGARAIKSTVSLKRVGSAEVRPSESAPLEMAPGQGPSQGRAAQHQTVHSHTERDLN